MILVGTLLGFNSNMVRL